MNFAIERPFALLFLLLLLPAFAFVYVKYRKLFLTLFENNSVQKSQNSLIHVRRSLLFRTFFRSLAWINLVLAYAGIYWGTDAVSVQKSGTGVALVFDISYSMEARDAAGGMSRLEAAANYAEEIIDRMEGINYSVVLAKGDGIIAVPLTEDKDAVCNLLETLSPHLMSSQGTSLGSGIKAAISSFPPQSSMSSCIWLFTDGDETDGSLASSLNEAVKYGIPVSIIGFGSERESEILAGDGKTVVKTALRFDSLKKIVSSVEKKNFRGRKNSSLPSVNYIDASEAGSAYTLLRSLKNGKEIDGDFFADSGDQTYTSVELKRVDRKNIFIVLALISFVLSFIAGEFNFKVKKHEKVLVSSLAFSLLLFTGCSARFKDGSKILEGRMEFNRKNYQHSTACFLQACEDAHNRGDSETENYALYGLAVNYMMQEEGEAALKKFGAISEDAGDELRFAVFYNSGIIAHRRGNYSQAALCFKNALKVDSSNTDAKINLELCLKQSSVLPEKGEEEIIPLSVSSDEQSLENAVYSIIRENEENKWKNQQQHSESSEKDY